jgi:DNA repair protein RadC
MVCDAASEKNEAVWINLFDNLDRVIFSGKVFSGSINSVKLDTRAIVELVLKKNASSMILMHNHPEGSVFPSNMDKDTTMELLRVFSAIGVHFKEHYIASGKCLFPIINDNGIINVKL